MNRIVPFLFLILLVHLNPGCISSGSSILDDQKQRFQRIVDDIVASYGIPGATFCAILPTGEVISLASGLADIERQKLMNPDDRMFSGSIGKTYVAAIILKLAGEGALGLDDPVSRFLGDQEWFAHLPNGSHLTIRMLLNHTSGLPSYEYQVAVWDSIRRNPDKQWTGEERLSMIAGADPVHPAGEAFGYSDSNYILLGMIIEAVTGREYYTVLKERVLDPLHLDQTTAADRRRIPGLVPGYSFLDTTLFHLPRKMMKEGVYAFNPQLEWTGGGVVTTAEDLAWWGKDLWSGAFLSTEELNLLITPGPFPPDIPEASGYGMATIIWDLEGLLAYGHTGFVPGYRSVVLWLPDQELALAMQINTDRLPEGVTLIGLIRKFIPQD